MRISQYLELPRKMRDARLKVGLSQQFIAKKLGIHQKSYARYENGSAEPSIEALEIFCKEVHITVPEVLGITDRLDVNSKNQVRIWKKGKSRKMNKNTKVRVDVKTEEIKQYLKKLPDGEILQINFEIMASEDGADEENKNEK